MISAVLTVYNGEKYLERCLNSLKNQTNNDFELIVIDDGSTDNSLQIEKNFQGLIKNYKIYSGRHKGVSAARNIGISNSKGEYITFIDYDDWLEPNAVDIWEESLNSNTELQIFSFYRNDSYDGKTQIKTQIKSMTQNQAVLELLNNPHIKGYVWNKLFCVSVIQEHSLRFDENIKFCEDLKFCTDYILRCNSIRYIEHPFYHYCTSQGAITSRAFSVDKLTALEALEDIISNLSDNIEGISSLVIKQYKDFYYNMLISLIVYGKDCNQLTSDIEEELKKKLFIYNINEISSFRIGISVVLGRISISALFFLWKWLKK